MRSILFFVLTIAAAIIPANASAADKSHRDILGAWCGSVSNYTITRERLIVTLHRDNSRRDYVIESFEFTPSVVTVNWKTSSGEDVWTKFGEFSADGRRTVQLSNEAGPRREFRRC